MASDRLFGIAVIVVALGYIASATTIETSFLSDPVGSKAFPIGIGVVASLAALVLVLRPDPDPEWPVLRTFGSLLIATIVLVGYAFALKPLGFLLPTAVAAGILSYQISPRVLTAVMTGVLLAIVLFVVFKFLLGLGLFPLPPFLTAK